MKIELAAEDIADALEISKLQDMQTAQARAPGAFRSVIAQQSYDIQDARKVYLQKRLSWVIVAKVERQQ